MSKNIDNDGFEIVVETKEISYIFTLAASVVEKRNILPELSNVKLIAHSGVFQVGATDLDLYLNQNIAAQIRKEGETTVSIQTLSEIVKKISDKEITLKQFSESQRLHIISTSCKFDLPTLDTRNFPHIEDISPEISLKINCKEFSRILEYTSFAMSNEETRYNLNGMYLHVRDKEFLTVAATDAHRLAVASSKIDLTVRDFGVILSKKTVNEVLKISKDTRNIYSELTISLAKNKAKFFCNNVTLICKLIDAKFPEYTNFIPTSKKSVLIINTKLLAKVIDRVSTVTIDKFRAIKFFLNNTNIVITARGEAKGTASETINFSTERSSYCSFSGDSIAIGFNPKYIVDVLNTLKEEQVQMHLNDSKSPVLIKTLENPKDSFVIMPIKV